MAMKTETTTVTFRVCDTCGKKVTGDYHCSLCGADLCSKCLVSCMWLDSPKHNTEIMITDIGITEIGMCQQCADKGKEHRTWIMQYLHDILTLQTTWKNECKE